MPASTKYLFNIPDAETCRKKLTEIYPDDKAKFRKMHARQVKRVYESVLLKQHTGVWH